MVAATEAADVGRLGLGQQDVSLPKGTSGLGGGVKRRGTEIRSTGAPYQSSAGGRIY